MTTILKITSSTIIKVYLHHAKFQSMRDENRVHRHIKYECCSSSDVLNHIEY